MNRLTTPTYKTGNGPAYSEALKYRGSLTIWFDPAMTWDTATTGKRERQPNYSDAAIQTCLTMKVLFRMAFRQTTGLIESLLRLIGLNWACPLRQAVATAEDPEGQRPLSRLGRSVAALFDSTRIKV